MASGETDTIEGWLAYGAALNEGRAMFPSDELFGDWLVTAKLAVTHDHERAAAMWAARDQGDFDTARAQTCALSVHR